MFKNDEIEAYRSTAVFQINLFKRDKTEIHAILSNSNTYSLSDWTPLTSRHTVGV